MKPKLFDLDARLVRFTGEMILFLRQLTNDFELQYYKKQLIRSSGSAALNYSEAQGTVTDKDFINKVSLVVKELKETRAGLKVLAYIDPGQSEKRDWLLSEVGEIIAITSKMILNKRSN